MLAAMESAAAFADMTGLAEAWRSVLEVVLTTPAHTDFSISKVRVPHPSIVDGFVRHFGDLSRAGRNYRFPLPDGREFHVKEYTEIFLAHWDKESAVRNPLGHLLRDAPHWVLLGGLLGGVLPAAAVAVVRGLWQGSKAKRKVKIERKK